jgi:hypothetical protein
MSRLEFQGLLEVVESLSPEQMHALRDELNARLALGVGGEAANLTADEMAELELQRQLFEAGLLSEIKLPSRLMPEREAFTPIVIEGEPLSETIIRERG